MLWVLLYKCCSTGSYFDHKANTCGPAVPPLWSDGPYLYIRHPIFILSLIFGLKKCRENWWYRNCDGVYISSSLSLFLFCFSALMFLFLSLFSPFCSWRLFCHQSPRCSKIHTCLLSLSSLCSYRRQKHYVPRNMADEHRNDNDGVEGYKRPSATADDDANKGNDEKKDEEKCSSNGSVDNPPLHFITAWDHTIT